MRKTIVLGITFFCALTALTARTAKKTAADYTQFHKKLSKDDQILHALDRLTFGPRPADVAAVKKMGVKKWIDLQLHPERIQENPELAAKLAPLDSLRLSQAQMASSYPNPQMIRAIAEGRRPLPQDPVARAAAERLARRYKVKRDAAADGNPAPQPGPNGFEPVVRLDQFLSMDQMRTLRNGTVDQKKEVLATIASTLPEDKLDDVVISMPPPMRNQVMAVAPAALRRKLMLMDRPQQLVFSDLAENKLYRAIYSNRQLEEELVDFWYNHFNVFLDKGADRFMVTAYERDVIRPHVLGRFRDFLEATASSPAMLFYLDNWESVAPNLVRRPLGNRPQRGLNENYARELMELHTLGVDGGYTQHDIIEIARCFTGWTIRNPQAGGSFFYNDRVHDKGEKIVLGVKIPAGGGRDDAEKVLDILAKHPSTARFISKKLAQRFIADDPPPELVERMAKTFLDTDGDLREVMRTMLTSNEFFSAGAYRAKVKTPFEMIASALRSTDADVDYALPLAQQIGQLGEPLYRKIEPTGYSSANAEWVSSASLLGRMNFAIALAQNKVPGVKVDASQFRDDPAREARRVLLTDASPQTKAAIVKALADQKEKNPNAASPALVAGLVLGSPDFQRR